MVNMETPKCRKLRRVKGSSKKKKNIPTDVSPEPRIEKRETVGPSAITTPPRNTTIIERGREEVRGVEWQYHGKFVETDTPVVWGSPHGSPVVNAGKVCESPVNKSRRRTISGAPRNLNTEECEPPQFLNEILALSEKIKSEEKVDDKSSDINEGEELTTSKNELEESFSNFFDEDMNECMLQCSQELDQTSLQTTTVSTERKEEAICNKDCENRQTEMRPKTLRTSPRRKITIGSASKPSLNTASGVFYKEKNVTELQKNSSKVGVKNYVLCNRKVNTYVFQGRVLGSRPNTDTQSSSASGHGHIQSNTSLQCKKSPSDSKLQFIAQKTAKSNRSCASFDNSFETVKESFLDDDLEFLSTIPDDLEMVLTENAGSPRKKSLGSSEPKHLALNQVPKASVLEDTTYFEDGVLRYLDSIESNVTPTQPLRCTPEEIEKKRQEAKLKLQKKQMLAKKKP